MCSKKQTKKKLSWGEHLTIRNIKGKRSQKIVSHLHKPPLSDPNKKGEKDGKENLCAGKTNNRGSREKKVGWLLKKEKHVPAPISEEDTKKKNGRE